MKQRIVLLGPPASGKGTQAEMIREKFRFETPSPGAILRREKANGSPIGVEADKFTSRGQLVPDELVVAVMRDWIEKHEAAFVLDGFPRTLGQADALGKILAAHHSPIEAAVALDLDFKTIAERVARRMVCKTCGNIVGIGWHVGHHEAACPRCGGALERRKDDTLEVLQQRMIEYREKSEPLIPYYEQRRILFRLDASRPAEEVFADIVEILAA